MANVMSMLEKLKWVDKVEKNHGGLEIETFNKLEDIEEDDEEEEVNFGEYKTPVKIEEPSKVETKPIEEIKAREEIKVREEVKPIEVIKPKAKHDRNVSISEIYAASNIENSTMNTVFLLESYINALPQELPYDVKKASVINIVNATKSDLNQLLKEGENRIKVLNTFMNEFQQSLNTSVVEYKTEIFKLSKMIDEYKVLIEEKETMLDEEKNIVKFESNKINNIIDFFKNENKH